MHRTRSIRLAMGRLCLVGAVAAVMGAPTRAALGSPPLACGSWTIVPSPDAGSNGSTLAGVSAPSRSDVWAVGSSFTGTVYRTLAEHCCDMGSALAGGVRALWYLRALAHRPHGADQPDEMSPLRRVPHAQETPHEPLSKPVYRPCPLSSGFSSLCTQPL